LEFDEEKQIRTWDRHLGDQINLFQPFGTGAFEVLGASPIDIMISDPQGRRLGVRDGQQFLEYLIRFQLAMANQKDCLFSEMMIMSLKSMVVVQVRLHWNLCKTQLEAS